MTFNEQDEVEEGDDCHDQFPRRPSTLEWAVVLLIGLFALGCLMVVFYSLYGIQLGPGPGG